MSIAKSADRPEKESLQKLILLDQKSNIVFPSGNVLISSTLFSRTSDIIFSILCLPVSKPQTPIPGLVYFIGENEMEEKC